MSVNYPAQTLHTPTDSPIPQHTNLPGHHHHPSSHPGPLPLSVPHSMPVYHQPIDPQIINQPSSYAHHHPVHHHGSFAAYQSHTDADSFQDLLNAADHLDDVGDAHDDDHQPHDEAEAALDRDLDMLIEPPDDEDEDEDDEPMDVDLAVEVGGVVDLGQQGVDHDDLSKMSVNHLLASPEQPVKVELPGKDGNSGTPGKAKEMFDEELLGT